MVEKDNWRLTGQKRYLQGVTLRWKRYYWWSEDWDHDHCQFCWAKFMPPDHPYRVPDDLTVGYATAAREKFPEDYHWICEDCYEDFKESFRWKVVERRSR